MDLPKKDHFLQMTVHDLIHEKEKLKDEVINPRLNYKERMEIYAMVQWINQCIREKQTQS